MTFLMSGHLVDKQQKTGEHVDNIDTYSAKFYVVYMFTHFCCLSTRGSDVSSRFSSFLDNHKPSFKFFFYIFGNPGLLCGARELHAPLLRDSPSIYAGSTTGTDYWASYIAV